MAISSSVALPPADRGAVEGGLRRGGAEGVAQWGSCGRDGEGGWFSSSSLLSLRFTSSGLLFLLLWLSTAWWILRVRLRCLEVFALVDSVYENISGEKSLTHEDDWYKRERRRWRQMIWPPSEGNSWTKKKKKKSVKWEIKQLVLILICAG